MRCWEGLRMSYSGWSLPPAFSFLPPFLHPVVSPFFPLPSSSCKLNAYYVPSVDVGVQGWIR